MRNLIIFFQVTELKSRFFDCRQTVDKVLSQDITPEEQDLELERIRKELEVQR